MASGLRRVLLLAVAVAVAGDRLAPDAGAGMLFQVAFIVVDSPADTNVRDDVLTLREASADGVRLDSRSWRVNFPQSEPRPALSMLFSLSSAGASGQLSRRDEGGVGAWQIDLASESVAPVRTATAASFMPHLAAPKSRSIDLDATGRGNQSW